MPLVTVPVTAEDIEQGKKRSSRSCPIALSLKRLGYSRPWVGKTSVSVDNGVFCAFAELGDVSRKFVNRFDAGKPVEPFSFQLDLPGAHLQGGERS